MGYATITDLYTYGAPQKAFGQLTNTVLQAALDSASNYADGYLRNRWSLPLISWDTSITEIVCRIATYNLLSTRGFNPASGGDSNVEDRWKRAIRDLELIEKQQITPLVTPQPDNSPGHDQPYVTSFSVINLSTGGTGPNRGW
jgi:phage gp36-like protein